MALWDAGSTDDLLAALPLLDELDARAAAARVRARLRELGVANPPRKASPRTRANPPGGLTERHLILSARDPVRGCFGGRVLLCGTGQPNCREDAADGALLLALASRRGRREQARRCRYATPRPSRAPSHSALNASSLPCSFSRQHRALRRGAGCRRRSRSCGEGRARGSGIAERHLRACSRRLRRDAKASRRAPSAASSRQLGCPVPRSNTRPPKQPRTGSRSVKTASDRRC